MQKVIIVIPIHKPDPTKNELASFAQCYKVLGSHPICVVAPEGLNTEAYTQVVKDSEFLFIDKTWLSSIEQYNKLKISLYFYNLFKDYEYLLTYELDAWVFRDELLYWCDKGYDYIGAPWFEGYEEGNGSKRFLHGCNSGFSLRNIIKVRKILNRIEGLKKFRNFWFHSKLQGIIEFQNVPFFRQRFKIIDVVYFKEIIFDWITHYEDYYWTYIIPLTFSDFSIAPKGEALKFSFEVNPNYLFELNDKQLPFGCHAWKRYGQEFWNEFIEL